MGWGSVLSQLSSGPKFRKHRRIIQEAMGTRFVNEYSSLQKQSTQTFLADLGDTPTKFMDHIKRWEFQGHDMTPPSHLVLYTQILCDHFFENLLLADLYLTAASTILGITYGYTPLDANDEFIQLADEAAFESFRYGGPGSSTCDLIPFCKSSLLLPAHRLGLTERKVKYWPTWMPFSFYQKHAAYTRTIVEKLFSLPLQWTETRMVRNLEISRIRQ